MFPRRAVASVTGIWGMAGAVGGILIAKAARLLLDYYKSFGNIEIGYYVMFIICGPAYLLACLIMPLLVPQMKKIEIQNDFKHISLLKNSHCHWCRSRHWTILCSRTCGSRC
jgi:nitrate/nitrite transporter NarK